MKHILITVLLAVMQTLPPVPRKTANSPDSTTQNVKKDANNNQAPAAKPATAINPVTPKPEQNPSDPPSPKDADQSISVSKLPAVSVDRNWADWVLWGFNGLLVIAGFLGIRVAYKTLKNIARQTRSIHHQAIQVRKQTQILNKSAKAAQKAAEAALLNAQAVINSERAWIDGEIIHREQLGIHFYALNVSNHGKTPAKLLTYEVRWGCLPDSVPFSPQSLNKSTIEKLNRLFGSSGPYRVGDWFRIDQMFAELPDTSDMETRVLYTTILYEDVFATLGKREVHKTTFVYYCSPLLDSLERQSTYDDYS
jgi:hypothetical protein